MIKYNRTESKLLFQFSSENSNKPEELLLILLPVSDNIWQSLQTCCYSLIKGKPSRQRCDMEGQDFFEDKTKALMNLRIKRAPMTHFPNRPVPQVANRGWNVRQKPRKPSRPLFQTRINPTPSFEAPDTTPAKASNAPQEPSSELAMNPDNQPDAIRQSSPNPVATLGNREVSDIDDSDLELNEGGSDTMPDVEPESGDPSPAGLYYKSILKSGTLVPVRLNDLVVRLRCDKERETGGKRDKLDLFDGPWRIVEFDLPKNTYGMKLTIDKDKGDG
jgi:hypothetical protein